MNLAPATAHAAPRRPVLTASRADMHPDRLSRLRRTFAETVDDLQTALGVSREIAARLLGEKLRQLDYDVEGNRLRCLWSSGRTVAERRTLWAGWRWTAEGSPGTIEHLVALPPTPGDL